MRDGRYEGSNDQFSLVLRVDERGAGVISGDVSSAQGYLASMRTAPGVRVQLTDGSWPAVWQDGLGNKQVTGTISVAETADRPDSLTVLFRLDEPVNGLAANNNVVIADRVADELRPLGVEIETEADVRPPSPVSFQGTTIGARESLHKAGFAVRDVGVPTVIPRQSAPWDYSKIYTLLDDLMMSTAQAGLSASAWELHLLMLSRTTRSSLSGLMFDGAGTLPRQGAAVFVDEIRRLVPDEQEDRKIIQTMVHELGHALNLAHRFERTVGHAGSTSFMNYDWRYRRGNHIDEFWRNFTFTFDSDELEFLRHAPRNTVMPGTAAFHSIRYWVTGTSYSPYLPEVPWPGWRLSLTPPANGPVFAFGQPVFLQATLQNLSDAPVKLPSDLLDPKANWLEVLIRRYTGATAATLSDADRFIPMVQTCMLEEPAEATLVPVLPGRTLDNNLNLTFGSGGFAFAEPGAYDVIPLVGLPVTVGRDAIAEVIILGDPLRIRVAYPHDPAEEEDAMVLLRPDVGAWFALGGSDSLRSAREALEGVRERRQAARGVEDPVVAAIIRADGINAGRQFVRLLDGRFHQRASDDDRAADLLGSLDAAALRNFDPHTAMNTSELANQYAARRGGS